MSTTAETKQQTIATMIDGRVVDDTDRVAVCIKGTVEGFPATLEAIYATWPFGVVYTIEVNVVEDPSAQRTRGEGHITIYPRIGRGVGSIFTRLFLFESSGMHIGDKRLENVFNFSYDERSSAERLIHYPGVSEHLLNLNAIAKFSEVIIRPSVGIYLSQPNSFNSLDFDVCRSTFKSMGAIAKILHEAF